MMMPKEVSVSSYETSHEKKDDEDRSQSDMTSDRPLKKFTDLRRASHAVTKETLFNLRAVTVNLKAVTVTSQKNDDKPLLQIDVDDKQTAPNLSKQRTNDGFHVEDQNKNSIIRRIPKLNIVIMIVGTQGDVKPFVEMGNRLVSDHGHRVRLATHEKFRDTVRRSGLEFYPLGGDPEKLASYSSSNRIIVSVRTDGAGERFSLPFFFFSRTIAREVYILTFLSLSLCVFLSLSNTANIFWRGRRKASDYERNYIFNLSGLHGARSTVRDLHSYSATADQHGEENSKDTRLHSKT